MAKKILLADDSITIQKVISITFSSEEFDLEIVGDGDAAIAKARDLKPDLVMADVAMPGKTGYEVCSAVKNDPALKNTPVLLLAGTFEPLNKDEASKVKADDSIVKPFESQELLEKVKKLLSKEAGKARAEGLMGAEPETAGRAKKLEAAEDVWAAGDFLGFAEEEPKQKEEGSAGLPDLEFLEGGLFEEAPKEDLAPKEHDFTDLEFHEEELKVEEPKKETAKAAEPFEMEPFDLSQFGSAEIKEEPAKEPSKETFELETFGGFEKEEPKESPKQAPKETFELETFEPEPFGGFEKEPPKKEEPKEEEPKFEMPSFEPPFWAEPETKTPPAEEPKAAESAPAETAVEAEEPFAFAQPEIKPQIKEERKETAIPAGLFREEAPAAQRGVSDEEIAKTITEAAAKAEARFNDELNRRLEGIEAQISKAVDSAAARIEAGLRNDLSIRLGKAEVQVSQAIEGAASKVEERLKGELGSRLEKSLSMPAAQVDEVVKKAAREAIEKVAWEVVPELAEELIKAEIARFKEAVTKLK